MEFFNLENISQHSQVQLHNNPYPILIDGNGPIPCLCIGLGTLLRRSMSDNFRQQFTLYTSDYYWLENSPSLDLNELTIERICLDIIDTARQLKLKNYVLLGHSVFGGLVMEIAKYQDPELRAVIGIGATPGWDEKIIQFKNAYFDQHASKQRKLRFTQMQSEYQRTKNPDDSLGSVDAYYAESAKYFADEISKNEMLELWKDVTCNDRLINHLFEKLFPDYDFSSNIEKINVPVAVLGGRKDYDSVPLQLWKHYPTPKNFNIYDCGDVGHWPHLEASAIFDQHIEQWINSNTTG